MSNERDTFYLWFDRSTGDLYAVPGGRVIGNAVSLDAAAREFPDATLRIL